MGVSGGPWRKICELGRDGLPQDQSPGLLESLYDPCLGSSKDFRRQTTASPRGKSRHVEDVLDAHGDPKERRTLAGVGETGIEDSCLILQPPETIQAFGKKRLKPGFDLRKTGLQRLQITLYRRASSPQTLGYLKESLQSSLNHHTAFMLQP
jgi:hypothetical protein